MAIIGLINLANTNSQTKGSLEHTTADVYISLIDSTTGNPVNGNNLTAYYTVYDNDLVNTVTTSAQYNVQIPGQSVLIYSGLIQETDSDDNVVYTKVFGVTQVGGAVDPNPLFPACDLRINFINVDKPESAPGALDAQITVNASSTYLPIVYSLDNVNFQSSSTFTGLDSGLKTVYVTDANTLGCSANQSVTIPVISDLLVADPAVSVGSNTSRWNAAFNPIVFTYQRKDFDILAVTQDSTTGNAVFSVNTDVSTVLVNDLVYVNAGVYEGVFTVTAVLGSQLTVKTPFISTATGFININRLRPYYQLQTQITYQDKITGKQSTIISTNRPDSTGLIKADISNFLQSVLRAKDESDYTQVNYRDDNLSASYQIAYAENWDGKASMTWTPLPYPYYIVYAAKQLGDKYGGNLGAYVPFKAPSVGLPLAKWVTDFAEPAYSPGYPFDIGFIYSEDLAGLPIYAVITLLDINRNPIGAPTQINLLNEDGSFLLNQDGSKLIIQRASSGTTPLAQHIGLNRLLLTDSYADEVNYLNVDLRYQDNGTELQVMQTQTIRIDQSLDYNSVYLRWIGLTGSWNYYRFIYNQEVSLDVQNAIIIKNFVSDWENQDSIEEVIGKSAGQKVKVMAEDLSVADIKGLQSIKYSPKVQMLTNKNPVKWQTIVLNTATFSEYETLNGQAPFSVTFNMPSINIQTQ